MRTRTTGGFSSVLIRDWFTYECGTAPATSTGSLSDYIGEYRITNDVVTPRFQERVSKGEVIINPFSSTVTRRVGSETGHTWKCKCAASPDRFNVYGMDGPYASRSFVFGRVSASPVVSGEDVSALVAEVGTATRAQIGAPDAQLLVDAAEYRQTLSMLGKPADNLNRFLTQVIRDKNRNRATRALTIPAFLSREWLRYRYGVLPLLGSIDGTLKALNKLNAKMRNTARSTGQLYETSSVNLTKAVNGIIVKATETRTDQVIVRGGCLFEDYSSFASDVGLSPREVPSALWDLVPYSFVADHVLNMNDYLRSLTSELGRNILGSWTVTRRTTTVQRVITGVTLMSPLGCTNYSLLAAPSGSASEVITSTSRSPGLPLPSLQMRQKLTPLWLKEYRYLDYLSLVLSRLVR